MKMHGVEWMEDLLCPTKTGTNHFVTSRQMCTHCFELMTKKNF